jgi:hypothetical protein
MVVVVHYIRRWAETEAYEGRCTLNLLEFICRRKEREEVKEGRG